MLNKLIYLPGLNGLRAIAALFVVSIHVIIDEIEIFGLPFFTPFPPVAQFSVTYFFTISGFLITYLLLIEKETSNINVSNFYIRRILRIWPLYYLFIVACICLSFFNSNFKGVLSSQLYWYIFFLSNVPFVLNQVIKVFSHLWSIGVEEQFYAFWPWIMKQKRDMLIFSILLIFLTLFLLKIGSYFFLGRQSLIYLLMGFFRFYPMLIGAVGAILYYKKNNLFVEIISNRISQNFSWIVFFLISFGLIYVPPIVAHEMISIITTFIIVGQITVRNRLINLENNICNFLGQISYGIYIIHPLCIVLILPLLKPLSINVFAKSILGLVIVLLVTIILAQLSYQYYEKFFLKLKDKFIIIKTTTRNIPTTEFIH